MGLSASGTGRGVGPGRFSGVRIYRDVGQIAPDEAL